MTVCFRYLRQTRGDPNRHDPWRCRLSGPISAYQSSTPRVIQSLVRECGWRHEPAVVEPARVLLTTWPIGGRKTRCEANTTISTRRTAPSLAVRFGRCSTAGGPCSPPFAPSRTTADCSGCVYSLVDRALPSSLAGRRNGAFIRPQLSTFASKGTSRRHRVAGGALIVWHEGLPSIRPSVPWRVAPPS